MITCENKLEGLERITVAEIMRICEDGQTFLFVSRSKWSCELKEPFTHITGKGKVETSWEVYVEKTGRYKVGLSYQLSAESAEVIISCGLNTICDHVKKSKGFFQEGELNFVHYSLNDTLYLERGVQEINICIKTDAQKTCQLSSIDIYPEELSEQQEKNKIEAGQMRDRAWYKPGQHGMMFHWTAETYPKEGCGNKLSYEQAVEKFNTERFAEMTENIGASYVIFTMNHAIAHFPAPIHTWEKYYPGMTTKRDLVEDLYCSLKKRNIDLLLYLNFTCAYEKSERSGLDTEKESIIDLRADCRDDFINIMQEILKEIGNRYKDKVKGYWIDSCYQLLQQFGTVDFKELYLSAKEGYPDRLVTFNHWILPVVDPWIDCWAGESAGMIELPEVQKPDYGPAPDIYFHDLIIMEDDWGRFQKGKIPDTLYTAEMLDEYVSKIEKNRTMLTINAEIYQDGSIGDKTYQVLRELTKRRK